MFRCQNMFFAQRKTAKPTTLDITAWKKSKVWDWTSREDNFTFPFDKKNNQGIKEENQLKHSPAPVQDKQRDDELRWYNLILQILN